MTLSTERIVLDSFRTDFECLPSSLFKDFHGDCYDMKNKFLTTSEEEGLRIYTFPLTPPISPVYSPLASETGDLERLHPICDEFADELSFADENSMYFQEDNLKEILIKDCMWNGAVFEGIEKDKDKTVHQKSRQHQSRFEKIRLLSQTPPITEYTARVLSVDPAEIFPFPICSESVNEQNEIPSDSEEEEVEVDVVTIENSIKPDNEEEKRHNTDEIDETDNHSFDGAEIPSPTPSDGSRFGDFEDEKTELNGKIRVRRNRKSYSQELSFFKQGRKASKNNSVGSGESDESENDSEYTRATHNVLERKRRNDLKLKFQRLRDAVPELKDNDRAPKVSILRKSWEHISYLKREEGRLAGELDRQKQANTQLLKKLFCLNHEVQKQ